MSMTRRGFLASMLAACAAPAIVRADSLMRVVAPKIITPPSGLFYYDSAKDFTMEAWVNPVDGWKHFALVRRISPSGLVVDTEYIDGLPVPAGEHQRLAPGFSLRYEDNALTINTPQGGPLLSHVDEVRCSTVARDVVSLGYFQFKESQS